MPDVIRFGKVEKPELGVTLAPPEVAQRLGVEGVLVLRVADGSPAARAGLQPTRFDEEGSLLLGDIIMSVDGERTDSPGLLAQRLRSHQVGDTVTLGIKRGEQFARVAVQLRSL